MYAIGPLAILYFLYETFKEKEEASRKKLIAAFIFILFSIVFWAFYEQSGFFSALCKDNRNNLLFLKLT
jgi:POT family proton-dependent oligopeptide transporter